MPMTPAGGKVPGTAVGSKGQRIGYVRVSSDDQNPERQLDGVELDRVFVERASGKDTDRPKLQELRAYARDGDSLVVHSMDRLARNVDDLRRLVQEFTRRGVVVEFRKEALTFTGDDGPVSQLLLTMLGAVAQFERDLIRERQREGIAAAKRRGAYRGRTRSLTPDQAAGLAARAAAGEPKAALAREAGVSRETLYQYLRRHRSFTSRGG
jgi:DNA invertase Pin-like site-specific DNA recombinase